MGKYFDVQWWLSGPTQPHVVWLIKISPKVDSNMMKLSSWSMGASPLSILFFCLKWFVHLFLISSPKGKWIFLWWMNQYWKGKMSFFIMSFHDIFLSNFYFSLIVLSLQKLSFFHICIDKYIDRRFLSFLGDPFCIIWLSIIEVTHRNKEIFSTQ